MTAMEIEITKYCKNSSQVREGEEACEFIEAIADSHQKVIL
jgi:hypothetical protein